MLTLNPTLQEPNLWAEVQTTFEDLGDPFEKARHRGAPEAKPSYVCKNMYIYIYIYIYFFLILVILYLYYILHIICYTVSFTTYLYYNSIDFVL